LIFIHLVKINLVQDVVIVVEKFEENVNSKT